MDPGRLDEQTLSACTHQDGAAIDVRRTCSRCGNFVCDLCLASPSPLLCIECEMLRKVTLSPLPIVPVWRESWALLMGSLPVVLAVSVLVSLAEGWLDRWSGPRGSRSVRAAHFIGLVILDACSGLVEIAAMSGTTREEKRSLRRALIGGSRRLWQVLWADLCTIVLISLCSLLLIVPGLMQWAACFVAEPVAYFEEGNAVARSWRLTAGVRWRIFWVGMPPCLVSLLLHWELGHQVKAQAIHWPAQLGLKLCAVLVGTWSLTLALAVYQRLRHRPARG